MEDKELERIIEDSNNEIKREYQNYIGSLASKMAWSFLPFSSLWFFRELSPYIFKNETERNVAVLGVGLFGIYSFFSYTGKEIMNGLNEDIAESRQKIKYNIVRIKNCKKITEQDN